MTSSRSLAAGPGEQGAAAPVVRRRDRRQLAVAGACLVAALLLWVVSLPTIDPGAMNDIGLISVLPLSFWAAVVLILAGFCMSLRPALVRGPLPMVALAGLVLALHATPAIAYVTLRYSWAWKHLGIVDYILRHDALDPDAPFLAAYHNWPGFFAAAAWLARPFTDDPLVLAEIARFFPPVLNLLYLAVLPLIYMRLTTDRRLVWTATAVFVVGNWVGQDYFSPQGTAFLLYLVILALCLGPLAEVPRPITGTHFAPAGLFAKARLWIHRGVPAPPIVGPATRMAATLLALTLITAVTVTHQLTPMLLIVALAALWAIGRLSIGFVAFAALMEALWMFYFAQSFVAGALNTLVSEFGTVSSDTVGGMVNLSVVSPGQRWVSLASRGLTVLVVALALLGGVLRLRAGHRDAAAVVLTLAPLPLLVATSYGGEIVFRLYFFALPFLAFFAAAAAFPSAASGRSRATLAGLGSLLLLCVAGFLLANNGKDRQYRFTPSEVQASDWLYRTAPAGALLVEGSRNYPSQFRTYEKFTYVPLSEEAPAVLEEIAADPAGVLRRWLVSSETGGYVIITRSQKVQMESLGVQPSGALTTIEQALLASPDFVVVYATEDATIFALNEVASAFAAEPAPPAGLRSPGQDRQRL